MLSDCSAQHKNMCSILNIATMGIVMDISVDVFFYIFQNYCYGGAMVWWESGWV